MEQLILIFHVLAALAIVGLIMLQQGKGADMGASFGSGASQTLFGSTGSGNALTKATALLVALFFATSFGLAIVAKNMSMAGSEIDIPTAAVVESPAVAPASDLPVSDVPGFDDSPVTSESQPSSGLDIPAAETQADSPVQGEDIPK